MLTMSPVDSDYSETDSTGGCAGGFRLLRKRSGAVALSVECVYLEPLSLLKAHIIASFQISAKDELPLLDLRMQNSPHLLDQLSNFTTEPRIVDF